MHIQKHAITEGIGKIAGRSIRHRNVQSRPGFSKIKIPVVVSNESHNIGVLLR
jgi:hypothetical protein